MNGYTHCSHNISYKAECRECEILWLESQLEWLEQNVKKIVKQIEKIERLT